MYILDTNAFYYAADISTCTYDVSKLKNLITDNETAISSTTLFEFITKYRNSIDTVKKGGKYLKEQQINVIENSINPIPKDFPNDLETITETQLESIAQKILVNKIDVESKFITILFDVCLCSGYLFSARSSGKEPSSLCTYVLKCTYKMFAQENLDTFIHIFTEGYETNNCENFIKNCFYNLLAFELEKGIPIIERAKEITNYEDFLNIDTWLSSETYSADTIQLNSRIGRKPTSVAYLQRLAVDYWKANNDVELKELIQKLHAIFEKKSWMKHFKIITMIH